MRSGQLMQGLALLGGILGPAVGAFLVDKVFHTRVKPVIVIGSGVVFVACFAMLTPLVVASAWLTEVVLTLAGMGNMASFTLIYIVIAKNYPPQIMGKMTAVWMGLGAFGGVIGTQVGGMLVTKTGNYNFFWSTTAVVAAVALIAMWMITEGRAGAAAPASGAKA
jgi:MFS family permease